MVQTFESGHETLMSEMKETVPVVQFIMLYKVVLTFGSVDEILECDNSNESNSAVLSCGAVHYMYATQHSSKF